MMWMDYLIMSAGPNFTIKGDWDGEVMGRNQDGTWGGKSEPLYLPGDIFRVNEDGWLIKIGEDRDDTG